MMWGLFWARPARVLLIAFLVAVAACAQPATTTEIPHSAMLLRPSTILGINLALYDTNDQVVNSVATQQLLKGMAVPIIRMPFRLSLPDAYELQALRTIQRIGAVPLVIVHGPNDPNALVDDRHAISLVQEVFGAGTVYVEFGNEPDLTGFTAREYINAWNAVIPALKAMAPTYQFAGPVNFQADPAYVATFDKYANPRPDVNSWHEYACQPTDTNAYCMAHIADWSIHIHDINKAVHAAIGTTVPLMITEWNLDSLQDIRYSNPSFMHAWTARALQELDANVPNGLIAAMQYCVTNNRGFNLVDQADSLTPQGQTFFHALSTSGVTDRLAPITTMA